MESINHMRLLDWSSEDPAVNLALDEALLESVDGERPRATLRFWESPAPFVVLGTAQVLHDEVLEAHCKEDGMPILRRCTAGGCVLQGPGSLNYTLALPFADFPEVKGIHASYDYILERLCGAFLARGITLAHAGICDLALDGKKVSGNAQRRRREALLHHGSLLYAVDLDALSRYLREPKDRPDYRGGRSHQDFVTTLPLSPEALKEAVRDAFGVADAAEAVSEEEMARARVLADEKYRDRAWTYRR
jgi:lipoate---protein ligase